MKAVGRAKHLRKELLFTQDNNTNTVDDKSKHHPQKTPQGPKNRPQSHSKLNVHLIHYCKHGASSQSHPSSTLTTSNPIHPSVHALWHFTAASSFPSLSTESFVSCYQYIQLHSSQRLFSISNTGQSVPFQNTALQLIQWNPEMSLICMSCSSPRKSSKKLQVWQQLSIQLLISTI